MSNASKTNQKLISNSVWNIIGQVGALLAALIAIPILIRTLGQSSFGVFSICLALIGFSGILDLGISRAITAKVSHNESICNKSGTSESITAALYILFFLGIVLAVTLAISAEYVARLLIGNAQDLLGEVIEALRVLAVTIPIVLIGSGLRGVLEGMQAFKAIAKANMLTGALMFAVPAALSQVTTSVHHLVGGLFAVRIAVLFAFYWACKVRIKFNMREKPKRSQIVSLLHAGGWMTVSNVISPIMTNLDRIFVSSQISPAAAAVHVTAYELTTKALLFAGSIANATFPVFAGKRTSREEKLKIRNYFFRAVMLTGFAGWIPSVFMFTFAEKILSIWISPEFAAGPSTSIMQILSIGIAINALGYIPFSYIQGIGESAIVAKFHIFELALFLPGLYFALNYFGVIGAAVTWTARVCVDTVMLLTYSLKKLN